MRTLNLTIVFIFLLSCISYGQVSITLNKTFVESIKDKISYTGDFQLIAAPNQPHAAAADGDLHTSCMEANIGLPIVAEIMNAKDNTDAMDVVHNNVGGNTTVKITGVWRIWAEHVQAEDGSTQDPKDQTQGAHYTFQTSNPPHVFEIHPILNIGAVDCMNTLEPINGYTYKDADKAFSAYLKEKCTLSDEGDKLLIQTKTLGYNYAEFWIKPTSISTIVDDGTFITSDILDQNTDVIAKDFRVGFPKGSNAEMKLNNLGHNQTLHVIGMPRVNLDKVESLIGQGDYTNKPLPIEMIVVSTLD